MDRHSPLVHSAYHDLLRSLRDDRDSDLRGTPTAKTVGQRRYWYDSYRSGNALIQRYIGEDSPELRDRLDRARVLADQAKDRAAHRTRLVRLLRAEGMMSVDGTTGALMSAMARAGVFRLGGTVVGTHAFRLYEGELGLRYDFAQTAQTGDLDIAQFERLSLAVNDQVEEDLARTFADLSFAPVPALDNRAVWRWRQTKSDMLIEFLTPSFRPEEDIRDLPALGVAAQSLHFLNYLIAQPIPAAALYRSGVLVQIPRPERFAIHKLIVADRRAGRDAIKAEKDRLQAAFLIEALAEDRPDDLAEAYEDARARGPEWRRRIDATLARLPDTAAQLAGLPD